MIKDRIRIIQVNLQKSPTALSQLEQTAYELKIDLLLLQEVPYRSGKINGWSNSDYSQFIYRKPNHSFLYTAIVRAD